MSNSRLFIILVGLVGLVLTALTGCNSSPTTIVTPNEYRAEGVLVQEMNDDDAFAVVRLWRNDSILPTATLHLAEVPMAFFPDYQGIDSAYQALISPAASHAGTQAYFKIVDGNNFADSAIISITDTLSISNISPANHQLQGAGQVSLEWTAAVNAEGYALASVKADEVATGAGFSALAATGVTAGTIPPEAFIDPITLVADTGLYNIYVYAFTGAPDSALSATFLPVPLPGQVPDNIVDNEFEGRFGTVSVTLRDTIRVVAATR
jgi:hypothetical protein